MAKRYLPEEFQTKVNGHAFLVLDMDNGFLMSYTMKHLAEKFLSGAGRISTDERAIAGAALQHIMKLPK